MRVGERPGWMRSRSGLELVGERLGWMRSRLGLGLGLELDRDATEMRTSHLADVVEGAVQVHVGLHVHDDDARLAVGALGRLDVPGGAGGGGGTCGGVRAVVARVAAIAAV